MFRKLQLIADLYLSSYFWNSLLQLDLEILFSDILFCIKNFLYESYWQIYLLKSERQGKNELNSSFFLNSTKMVLFLSVPWQILYAYYIIYWRYLDVENLSMCIIVHFNTSKMSEHTQNMLFIKTGVKRSELYNYSI